MKPLLLALLFAGCTQPEPMVGRCTDMDPLHVGSWHPCLFPERFRPCVVGKQGELLIDAACAEARGLR